MSDLSHRLASLSPAKRALLQRKLQNRAVTSPPRTISRRTDGNPVPLSFAQQRLWFLDQLDPGSSLYNIPAAVRLCGPLDSAALERSLQEIIRRHEALRTTFPSGDGQPSQVIEEAIEFHLPLVDLRELPEPARESEARWLAQEEATRPFDLSRDLMLRGRLLRLGEQEHLLAITQHHIASDGWSIGVFWGELAALYEVFSNGLPSRLPDLPVQYADYAVWQRQWLQDEVLNQQLAYWKKQLAGAPAVLDLPTDFPRPIVQRNRGAGQELVLGQELTQALKKLSRQEGATLFMTLLAAWQVLLSRYSGQEDVVVGTPIAGRSRTELEGLIGFFVNALALRTDLSGNPTFRELLERVRHVTLGAYAHQDLPFEKLVEELHPERHLSHSPLFQVIFVLQNAPRDARELRGLSISPVEVATTSSKLDLTLFLHEAADGLRGMLEYNTDLFESATITRLLGHFHALLAGIVTDPERRIGDLPLLTEAERHQVLVEWNQTAGDYPRTTCLHELFEEQVERTPKAVAVIYEEQQLTYSELNARANQLARHLQTLGVGPETLVAICVDRSVEMIIGLLGILKAGGAYVPLDPTYPQERLAFLLKDSQAPVLLTQSHLLGALPVGRARAVCLDDRQAVIERESVEDLSRTAERNNLAYVIYTSGSTGAPKGVQIPHRAVVNFLHAMACKPGLREQDTLLAVTTLSFDISVLELFLPLSVGARVAVVSRDVASDGGRLSAEIANSGATVVQATPATWRLVIDAGWQGRQGLNILCGGEVLPSLLADQLCARCDSLWNVFGPTETTVWSTVHHVVPGPGTGSVPIGRPIANTTTYILDKHGHPVPVGASGELYIGGAGLARGYLNRPELTAEKFVPDPFNKDAAARLYRTGDLVRRRADGNLEYLGRLDQQVKLRGFRIELGEIEAVLAGHPHVRQAVVLLREDRPDDKRLAAYYAPTNPESKPSAADLQAFLITKLPEYMVPTAFVALDALPVTPNGKVNRKVLPAPDPLGPEREADRVAPRNAAEVQMTALWAGLLGVERVGIHDNFFLLGGHSLLAAKLIAQARACFDCELALRDLFEAPTVSGLLALMKRQPSSTRPERPPHGRELFIRGQAIDPDPFVDIIRNGEGKPALVCVGNAWPIPLMLERMPASVPVLLLKLDGTHLWPPRYLTLDEQVRVYVEALENHFTPRSAVLIGFSYGAFLAYRLASALQERLWTEVNVVLVEPSVPERYWPFWTRFRRTLRRLRAPLRIRSRLASLAGRPPPAPPRFDPDDEMCRWYAMIGHYKMNINDPRLRPLGHRIVLVGSETYLARAAECWQKIEPGGIEQWMLETPDDHVSSFRESTAIDEWLPILKRWYNDLQFSDNCSGSIAPRVLKPSSTTTMTKETHQN